MFHLNSLEKFSTSVGKSKILKTELGSTFSCHYACYSSNPYISLRQEQTIKIVNKLDAIMINNILVNVWLRIIMLVAYTFLYVAVNFDLKLLLFFIRSSKFRFKAVVVFKLLWINVLIHF